MKCWLFFLPFFCNLAAYSQHDTTLVYLNHNDEVVPEAKASKYAVQHKENNLWKRMVFDFYTDKIQNAGYYDSPACDIHEGPYNEFHLNGKRSLAGSYHANVKIGVWKRFNDNGRLIDSAYYNEGFIKGVSLSWNDEGFVTDSLVFEAGGNGWAKGYRSDKQMRYQGNYIGGKKSGAWQYYYPSGKKSQDVTYQADSAISFTCYDKSGELQQKNCFFEKEAEFPGGQKGWQKFLTKNLDPNIPVKKGSPAGTYTVVVRFVLNINGELSGIEAETTHGFGMEEEVIRILKKGPNWIPAVQYNMNVNAYRRQPVTFVISQ